MSKLQTRRRCVPAVSILTLALLGAVSMPAFAVDRPCLDAAGNPITPAPATDQGNEHGINNTTCSMFSSAYGRNNNASGFQSQAFGGANTVYAGSGDIPLVRFQPNEFTQYFGVSNAFGYANTVSGVGNTAVGYLNRASGTVSNVFGVASIASNTGTLAMGGWFDSDGNGYIDTSDAGNETAEASGLSSVAVGAGVAASADYSSAFGVGSAASGIASSAFGYRALASGSGAFAAGGVSDLDADNPTQATSAEGKSSVAIGNGDRAMGDYSTAIGVNSTAVGVRSTALGVFSYAYGEGSTAIGGGAAYGSRSLALGGQAANVGSTAIGYGSYADRDYSIAVGSEGGEHQIIHLAAGTDDFDAVNVGQLNPFAAAFGGGATWTGGIFTPPSYTIQGVSYGNVGAALAAIDGWMTSNANGVQYDDASHATATLDGASGTQVKNVADAVDPMDAVNKGQMDAGDAATLASANAHADAGDVATLTAANTHADAGDAATLTASKSYTDTKVNGVVSTANAYTDSRMAAWDDNFSRYQQNVEARFAQTDARIDRMGAMGGAMSAAAINTAGLPGTNRVGIGVGMQGGKAAVAVGYQRLVRSNVSVSLSGAFSGDDNSVSAGTGFSW